MAKDWRCTTKPGKYYIHLFTWPTGQFELNGVKDHVSRAYLLADSKRTALKVAQNGDKVRVGLPGKAPGEIASVLVLEHGVR
jgi:alpha-L-fucosidase